MKTVRIEVPKADPNWVYDVKTATAFDNGKTRVFTDSVQIRDPKTGEMSIDGYNFKTTLFIEGVNIKVSGADTIDPSLYINGKLAAEGGGMALILESILEVLKLECASQTGDYPTN